MPNYVLIAADLLPDGGPFSVGTSFEVFGSNSRSSWDDLRFPATNAKQLSGKEPTAEADTGLLLFGAAAEEGVAMLAQMPHAWQEATDVSPHVHWQKTTSASGDVVWQLEYKIAPIGEVMDTDWTTVTSSTPVDGTPDNDTANEHLITSFTDINMEGKSLSDCILLKLSRLGGDAADTYGADARMLEFDLHYQLDSFGSEYEYIK